MMKSNQISGREYFVIEELDRLHRSWVGQPAVVKLWFLYYAVNDVDGEALAQQLQKLNYEVEVDATGRKCDATRVFGTSTFVRNDDYSIRNWYVEMDSIGSYYECSFDSFRIIRNSEAGLEKEKLEKQ